MRTRLERRVDKQNSFNADQLPRSRTPKATKTPLTPSNSELRKKLEENLANYQKMSGQDKVKEPYEEGELDYESKNNSFITKGKRENAKNRGFDMKVNNIVAINEKINSLLSMVRKEKNIERNQKLDKLEKERAINRSREIDSPNVDLKQKNKKQQPSVSPFIKDKYETKQEIERTPKVEAKYLYSEARQEEITQEAAKRYNDSFVYSRQQREKAKEQSVKQLNLKQLRRKYLPQDEKPVQRSAKKEQINWESSFADQDYKYQKQQKPIKVENDAGTFKSKNIDKMLQERKKKREHERQEERLKFQKSTVNNNSTERQSKISFPSYEQQKMKSFKQSNVSQKDLLPQIATENPRNEKINATTRLIDEQIQRIKSKIQQSETNNQKNQIKLQVGSLQNHKRSQSQSINQHIEEKEHTARIATKISSQVQLDNLLRQARVAFEKVPGEEKWEKLQKELQAKGMKFSLNLLKELIRVSSDQHNPFAGDTKNSQGLTDIANLFVNAQTNWEDYVCGCTSMKKLLEQGYNTEDLDLSQKGSLSVEDIVCFVNLYTGHFYRNRDLALIFRRLQLQAGESGPTLSYEGFQKALSV